MAMVSGLREFRGRVEISLDGVVWLKLPEAHFAKCPLTEGEAVDPEAYVDSLAAIQAADCYEAALTLLDRAARTGGDLRSKLVRAGYVAPVAEATVERLRENGLIDDRRYAERVAHTQKNKPVGAYALRRKLRAKQLSEEDIDAALAPFDEEQQRGACRDAAEKLWHKYADLPSREAKAKLSQALARRGFGWDVIRSAVAALTSDFDEWDQ